VIQKKMAKLSEGPGGLFGGHARYDAGKFWFLWKTGGKLYKKAKEKVSEGGSTLIGPLGEA